MKVYDKEIHTIQIVFFSGTGGTARAAKAFANAFAQKGLQAVMTELHIGAPPSVPQGELLILIYPVYALNAPYPVFEWIAAHKAAKGTPAAVISVSGGGEITPNTACRVKVNRTLAKAGYDVVYEHMMVMPSNLLVAIPDDVAVRLLRVLPQKVECIVEELLHGSHRRTKPYVFDRMMAKVGELERYGSRKAGKRFYANDSCNACGLCVLGCPRGNIIMKNGKPVFGAKCVLCLHCVYACKKRAIQNKDKLINKVVFKEGYDLTALETRMEGKKLRPVEELAKGFVWKSVRDYLRDYQEEDEKSCLKAEV